ncbi:MAG: uroporphyrinogen-III C-methyltransferase, partial [Verrucomicrobiales bacterium]|nr:uroporphyrinogen-III C-methyltransferase [Verrucomicrobiales bacterium]
MNNQGICYLTGSGPGDAGLLTLRAAEVLRGAEVVVYDNLINESVLSHAPASAERIYVGKRAGRHEWRQRDINKLLVELTVSGKIVVRLKGGDPFVFGRGGEEAEALTEAGARFEIVPGVTAGIAAAAFAGIPVTQRGRAGAVLL